MIRKKCFARDLAFLVIGIALTKSNTGRRELSLE